MGAQQVFDAAQAKYNEVIETLSKFANIIEQATEGKFSTDIALVQFDCILQYMLLHEAVADGKISHVEQQFINFITDRGDILKVVKAKTDVELTWDELEAVSGEAGQELLKALTPIYGELLADFVGSVAKVDGYIKEVDLLKLINDNIIGIFALFSQVDGESTDAERDSVVNAYVDLFVSFYQKAVEDAENE
ncbi:MAG: hypothetical protein IJW46_05645 [Clostridia bacterium]|nr:hypothetical protein [Clostridia bacterium]